MVGIALQYQRGALSKEDVISMIEHPEVVPTFQRELARPEGLTMIGCKYKKGMILDEPIEIPEEFFLKNQKKKLRELGVETLSPEDEEKDYGGVGSLFESS